MWLAKESVLWKRGWYTFAPVSAHPLCCNAIAVDVFMLLHGSLILSPGDVPVLPLSPQERPHLCINAHDRASSSAVCTSPREDLAQHFARVQALPA